jgi:hypothetical protein
MRVFILAFDFVIHYCSNFNARLTHQEVELAEEVLASVVMHLIAFTPGGQH